MWYKLELINDEIGSEKDIEIAVVTQTEPSHYPAEPEWMHIKDLGFVVTSYISRIDANHVASHLNHILSELKKAKRLFSDLGKKQ